MYRAEIIVGHLLPSHHYRSDEKKIGTKLGNDILFIGRRKKPLGTEYYLCIILLLLLLLYCNETEARGGYGVSAAEKRNRPLNLSSLTAYYLFYDVSQYIRLAWR